MSEIHIQIKEAEESLEHIKAAVTQRDQVIRLMNNPDFKAIVIDGYMRDECARYAKLSVDMSLGTADRADSLGIAQSAGYFQRWLNVLIQMGNAAEGDLSKTEEILDELRSLPEDGE